MLKRTEPPGCIILADFLCCWGSSEKETGLGGRLGRTLGNSSAQSSKAWQTLSYSAQFLGQCSSLAECFERCICSCCLSNTRAVGHGAKAEVVYVSCGNFATTKRSYSAYANTLYFANVCCSHLFGILLLYPHPSQRSPAVSSR